MNMRDSRFVMQEVMGQIVTDVAENSSTEYSYGCVPIIEEYRMGELVKRGCEDDEESGWHDQAVFVHGKVVVYAMKEEVGRDSNTVVR